MFAMAGLTAYAGSPVFNSVSLYACGPSFAEGPPVTNLTAAILNHKEIRLNWEISETRNILHFEVQHSTNGRSFSAIGIVKFKLNAESAKTDYQFQHIQPAPGKNFYRIKTIYLNRSTDQSITVPIVFSQDTADKNDKEALVFPNPSENGIVYFSTKAKTISQYQLYVFDLDGKLVRQKLILSNQTTIIQQLTKGTYLFEIFRNDDRIDHGQLVVR